MVLLQLRWGPEFEPRLKLPVILPLSSIQFLRGTGLQDVPWHGEEHIEQRLELKPREVVRLQRGGIH